MAEISQTSREQMPKISNYDQSGRDALGDAMKNKMSDLGEGNLKMIRQMNEAQSIADDVRFHASNSHDYKQVHERE